MTTITALPAVPSRADPANFAARGDALLGALPTFVTEVNAVGVEVTAASGHAATATTKAGEALASANAAAQSAVDADADATTATTQAGTATTQAGIATTQAGTATTQAGIATTQAGNASTSASNALTSETNAATASQAIKWAFSTTTAMADPGAGTIRFNHATPASVTAIALDDLDAGAVDISAYVITWDDSTNTNKGTLTLRQTAAMAIYTITGLTDNAGWTELAVMYVTGSGSFSDAATTYSQFSRTGDKGADGSGAGDFSSNTAVSVDSELMLFSGTGGKTGKRATTTGLLKAASGVLAAAVSRTDYAEPTTALATGLLKNTTTTGAHSIAVAGTDYQAAITATGLLKGSGSGTVAAATVRTDYAEPTTALATGILKNTTTTGAHTIATGADLPAMTATVGGAVPTPPNNTTTFLRGDGTFSAVGGGSWIYISTITASGAATADIEWTNGTYDVLVIVGHSIFKVGGGGATGLRARLKVSGTYQTTSYNYWYSSLQSAQVGIDFGTIANSGTNSQENFIMYMMNPSSSVNKKVIYQTTGGTDTQTPMYGYGVYTGGTGALTGVRFSHSAADNISGTFRLYGIKNS